MKIKIIPGLHLRSCDADNSFDIRYQRQRGALSNTSTVPMFRSIHLQPARWSLGTRA
jgi:hypothetical protein